MCSIFRVDSSEIAFLLCGHGCMKQVFDNATKSILEPVMSVEVTYPNEFDQRVTMLLMDRHVEIDETETDYLVSPWNFRNWCDLNFNFSTKLFTVRVRWTTCSASPRPCAVWPKARVNFRWNFRTTITVETMLSMTLSWIIKLNWIRTRSRLLLSLNRRRSDKWPKAFKRANFLTFRMT